MGADGRPGFQRRSQVRRSSPSTERWAEEEGIGELTLLLHSLTLHSVRVSNELGAGHPKAAKFSVAVAVSTSAAVGVVFTAVVLIARVHLPRLFTGVPEVERETAKLAYLLAPTILLNSIQPVLSGAPSWKQPSIYLSMDFL